MPRNKKDRPKSYRDQEWDKTKQRVGKVAGQAGKAVGDFLKKSELPKRPIDGVMAVERRREEAAALKKSRTPSPNNPYLDYINKGKAQGVNARRRRKLEDE